MDEYSDKLLTADLTGPSKAPILRTPAQEVGARLSKKFKAAAFVLVGIIAAAIMIGILTAGNNPAATEAKKNVESNSVGKVAPDTAAFERAAAKSPFFNQGENSQPDGNSVNTKSNAPQVPPNAVTPTANQASNGPKTPAENFQAWQEEQHYKAQEARFTASQAAKTSSTQVSQSNQSTKGASDAPVARATFSNTSNDDPTRLNNLAAEVARNSAGGASGAAGPNGVYSQSLNTDFISSQKKAENGYLTSTVNNPLGQTELFAGGVIPAVLTVGINSDLPGQVNGMVRQTVYDSRNEHIVLIPQGTKVIGQYNSSVSYGQKRVLVAWNQLIFPNGKKIDLQGMLGADGLGQSGLYDSVDNHYFRIFGSALLVSMLGVAAQLSQPQNSSLLAAPSISSQATGSATSQINNVGTNLVNKNLNIAPTLIIQPGFAFNILVNKTMILPAYQ